MPKEQLTPYEYNRERYHTFGVHKFLWRRFLRLQRDLSNTRYGETNFQNLFRWLLDVGEPQIRRAAGLPQVDIEPSGGVEGRGVEE